MCFVSLLTFPRLIEAHRTDLIPVLLLPEDALVMFSYPELFYDNLC